LRSLSLLIIFLKKLLWFLKIIFRILFNSIISIIIISFSIYLYAQNFQSILANTSILPTIFIAIGSTLITILILSISIAIIPIQRSIDSFSKSISYLYRSDKINTTIFILISLFALFAFISSIDRIFFAINTPYLFPINLITVGITLDLLRWHHRRVALLLEPDEAIKRLKRNEVKFIKKTHRILWFLSKLYCLVSLKKGYKKTDIYEMEKSLYLANTGHYNHINKKLGELTEISIKALAKNEIETVETIVSAISSITISYIYSRKNNLTFYPSKDANYLVNECDADKVFNKAYESLFNIAIRAHKEEHEYPSIYCLRELAKIIESICNFLLTSKIHGAKDLLFIPIDYFGKILDDAQNKNLDEVVFQGNKIIEEISKNIYSKEHIVEIDYTLNDMLIKLIMKCTISNKQSLGNKVLEQIMNRLFMLIPNYPYTITNSLKNVIEKFEEIFPLALSVNNSLKNDLVYFHFSVPYQLTNDKSFSYFVQKAALFNKVEKDWINPYQNFIDINHVIYLHFRNLADNNDLGNSTFLWHVSTSINYIIKIYFDLLSNPLSKIDTFQDELIEQISWYLSFFWSSFSHSTKIKRSYAEEAFEVVAQIGLSCYNKDFIDQYSISRYKLIDSCISDLTSMIDSYSKTGEDKNQYNIADFILYLWYMRLAAKNNSEGFRVSQLDAKIKELDIIKSDMKEDVIKALELRYKQMMERILEEDRGFFLDQNKAIGLLRKLNKNEKFYGENSIVIIF